MDKKNNCKGSLLFEIIIYISLIGLIYTQNINLKEVLEKNNRLIEIEDLKSDIYFTRNLAISTNNMCCIKFILSKKLYFIKNISRDEILKVKKLNNNLKLISIYKNAIVFQKNGVPLNGGYIYYTNNNKKYKITITPVTGQVNEYVVE